jgi:tetratricopeptide (TPR) repeat protein
VSPAGAVLIAVAASAAAADPAGRAPRQGYTPPPAAIAPVAMAASCRPEASAEVDRGAAWLLVGEPETARAAFDRAVDHDPDCALGYWGQAVARLPRALDEAPDDGRAAATASGIAIEATIGRALAVPARTPFERAAVAALQAMRDRVAAPGVPAAWPARIGAYRDALCAGAGSDRRIRLWCARALADAAISPYMTAPAADALAHAVELGRDRPLDAGVAFIILQVAQDRRAPIVARAREAITATNPPAPWPHLAVVDAAVAAGEWAAAAAASARAAAVTDSSYARRRAIDAELTALMQLGRRREAYARAGAVVRLDPSAPDEEREIAARAVARLAIADRRIDGRGLGDRTAIALGPREAGRWPAVFVAALDAALRAWPGGDATLLAEARASLEALQALAGEDRVNEIDWASTIVEAAIAASQDEHQQMALFLTHAAELENDPRVVRFGHGLLVPTREIAAELWLRTYRYDDARREARAVLEEHPGRVGPYVVLARTAVRRKDTAAATEAWRRVLALRTTADPDDTLRFEAQRALEPPR